MTNSTIMSTAASKRTGLQDEAAIRAILAGIQQAHHDKDADAIAAPYAPDAVVYDLEPPLAHQGIDVARKKAWLDTWDGPIDREWRDLKIRVSGDLSVCEGFLRMSGIKKSGPSISFWMRCTVCLQREQGTWRIVHNHASVPFYMDGTFRPAFDLIP